MKTILTREQVTTVMNSLKQQSTDYHARASRCTHDGTKAMLRDQADKMWAEAVELEELLRNKMVWE